MAVPVSRAGRHLLAGPEASPPPARCPALLAACGGSSSGVRVHRLGSQAAREHDRDDGPAQLSGLVRPHEFADFSKLHPGLHVKSEVSGTTGAAATLAQIENNEGAFDLSLGGVPGAAQLEAGPPAGSRSTPRRSPTSSSCPRRSAQAFPCGIPTDFGKTGYAYRKDLISERPTSWNDLFALAPKYSGKITMIKYDSDIQGSFLKALGYSVNTKVAEPAAGDAEADALVQAASAGDPRDRLLQGADRGHGARSRSTTTTTSPRPRPRTRTSSGCRRPRAWPRTSRAGRVEGVQAPRRRLGPDELPPRAEELRVVHQLHRRRLRRARGREVHRKRITDQPELRYDTQQLSRVEFERYLGPEQAAYARKLWEEFLAA